MCCIEKGKAKRLNLNGQRFWRSWRVDVEQARLTPVAFSYKCKWHGIMVRRLSWAPADFYITNLIRSRTGLYAHKKHEHESAIAAHGTVRLFGLGYSEGNDIFAEVAVIDEVWLSKRKLLRIVWNFGGSNRDWLGFQDRLKRNYPTVKFHFTR